VASPAGRQTTDAGERAGAAAPLFSLVSCPLPSAGTGRAGSGEPAGAGRRDGPAAPGAVWAAGAARTPTGRLVVARRRPRRRT